MSEKRPETSADILSRSKVLTAGQVRRDQSRHHHQHLKAKQKRYSVDLSSHMAECDANYQRLMRIFPNLREVSESRLKLLVNTEQTVVFDVLEKGPFTTLLRISFGEADNAEAETTKNGQLDWVSFATTPQLTVRVYHDAKSAEVVSYQNQMRFHGVYEYPNMRMRQRDEKVQLNRFLSEFLSVCLQHGASIEPVF